MIKKSSSEAKKETFDYIGKDYAQCLYLYLDLLKYGFDSDITDIYVQSENGIIKSVMLKYYSCIHVYSRDNAFDAEELGLFIKENSFSMVYCNAETAKRIYDSLPETIHSKATITTGWVAQIQKINKSPKGLAVNAKDKDFDQIVRLIYEDEDIGRSYNFDDLARQLKERNAEGYARNLVIKQDDLVIAHACTNAETESIAVVAELLVRKEYRRKGYASEIWRDLCKQLLSENKSVFSFYYSDESRNLHKHIGFTEVCEWAKIVIVQG